MKQSLSDLELDAISSLLEMANEAGYHVLLRWEDYDEFTIKRKNIWDQYTHILSWGDIVKHGQISFHLKHDKFRKGWFLTTSIEKAQRFFNMKAFW